jgi:hypothetical protein
LVRGNAIRAYRQVGQADELSCHDAGDPVPGAPGHRARAGGRTAASAVADRVDRALQQMTLREREAWRAVSGTLAAQAVQYPGLMHIVTMNMQLSGWQATGQPLTVS